MAKNYSKELIIFVFASFVLGFITPFFFIKSFFGTEKNYKQQSIAGKLKKNQKKFEDIEYLYADIYNTKGR